MKGVPAPGLRLAAMIFAATLSAHAALSELPGGAKPKRVGFVITVEGGEEGTQSVFYNDDGKRVESLANPVPAAASEAPRSPPVASAAPVAAPAPTKLVVASQSASAETSFEEPNKYEGSTDMRVDPVVNRFTGREQNLSERTFDRQTSANFGRDDRFAGKDAVTFDRWARGSETFEKETAPGVSFSDKFAAERVEKETVTFAKRDRESYARGGDKAEVPGRTGRFARDRNGKFADNGVGSALRERISDGYRMLMQVSMQDINRTNFRRNHSTEKGDLPVGRVGAGELATMSKSE